MVPLTDYLGLGIALFSYAGTPLLGLQRRLGSRTRRPRVRYRDRSLVPRAVRAAAGVTSGANAAGPPTLPIRPLEDAREATWPNAARARAPRLPRRHRPPAVNAHRLPALHGGAAGRSGRRPVLARRARRPVGRRRSGRSLRRARRSSISSSTIGASRVLAWSRHLLELCDRGLDPHPCDRRPLAPGRGGGAHRVVVNRLRDLERGRHSSRALITVRGGYFAVRTAKRQSRRLSSDRDASRERRIMIGGRKEREQRRLQHPRRRHAPRPGTHAGATTAAISGRDETVDDEHRERRHERALDRLSGRPDQQRRPRRHQRRAVAHREAAGAVEARSPRGGA